MSRLHEDVYQFMLRNDCHQNQMAEKLIIEPWAGASQNVKDLSKLRVVIDHEPIGTCKLA